jgi:hypothetical protein
MKEREMVVAAMGAISGQRFPRLCNTPRHLGLSLSRRPFSLSFWDGGEVMCICVNVTLFFFLLLINCVFASSSEHSPPPFFLLLCLHAVFCVFSFTAYRSPHQHLSACPQSLEIKTQKKTQASIASSFSALYHAAVSFLSFSGLSTFFDTPPREVQPPCPTTSSTSSHPRAKTRPVVRSPPLS